jgi:hypothetical protein
VFRGSDRNKPEKFTYLSNNANLSDKTTDLLPSPSAVQNIVFDPINSQRIFVCAEGGII